MGQGARPVGLLPVVASLTVAAALAGAALVTVSRAGCEDPGRYLRTGHGIELVGGCLAPGDLPVAPQAPQAPATEPEQPLPGAAPLRG